MVVLKIPKEMIGKVGVRRDLLLKDEDGVEIGKNTVGILENVVIGRSDSCDIIIKDSAVSREHAKINKGMFGAWRIKDLNSKNGTFVIRDGDTLRVDGSGAKLKEKDSIRIGQSDYLVWML